jgi:hemerythrin-like metal-binding protein
MKKIRIKTFSNLFGKYVFSDELSLEARLLNMVYLVGIGAALTAAISRVLISNDLFINFVMAAIAGSVAFLWYVANRFKIYTICKWITLIVLCDILLPMAYFALGGLASGMAAYFVLSIAVIYILSGGVSRVFFLISHLAIVFACYYLSSLPGIQALIPDTSGTNRYLDHIQSFLIAGFFVGTVFVFQNRIYTAEKQKAETANIDLAQRDKLLRVVNQAAEMLLASDMGKLATTLVNVMGIMARAVNADRMYIWRKSIENEKPCYTQEYEWVKESASATTLNSKTGTTFIEAFPVWDECFAAGKITNGPVTTLTPQEQALFFPFDVKSVLIIPVYLQENFWGFVTFDDCREERFFPEDEVNILRSASLLLANAVVKKNSEDLLNRRLIQQELMSDISQSFVSEEPMDDLINGALARMGKFMGISRNIVSVVDKNSGESCPVYIWFSSEMWTPGVIQTGFSEIFGSMFPKHVPDMGYVPTVYCEDSRTVEDERFRIFYERAGVKAFIWAPIYIKGEFWGLLSVEDCVHPRQWSESDAQLAATVSSSVSGAVARDLMDRERSAALEKAVLASKAKGDFLSNMSHEMRTPMNAIIGMTSIGKNARDIERKDYAFGKIEDASTHLLGVINDILDMSKIEANKLELSPVSFEFEKMLQKVVNVINFKVEERSQSFYVTIDKKIPHTLIGDDQRLAQVITNLLSNAIKFTPENGNIRLNAQCLGEENGFYTMRIEVSDSGIGVSTEQQARLFNSFEQAESSTTRKFGGTGLGLAISKRSVEMMGGKIWLHSELGKGSDFFFTFVMKKAAGEGRKAALNPGVNWNTVRIMAVDDDDEILKYFVDITQRFGVYCDAVSSGEDALKLLKTNGPYDIYFIDWKMPGMNGLELSKKIREHESGKSVVTMISGVEWSAIEKEASEAGVDKFIGKPLFPSAIADLINECLGADTRAINGNAATDAADSFEGRRMLLVEDVEINREIVQALLEPTLLEIDCAVNGREAVEMFAENPEKYDMIFMDVQMPEMDGYEATRRIRQFERNSRERQTPGAGVSRAAGIGLRPIPIVAMTANVFREDIERSLEAGMNDHVGKPLDFSEVLAKLRKYLPGRSERGSSFIKYGESGKGEESWKNGIAWSDDLATGNSEIDSQHKQIFRLTSNLADACAKNQSSQYLEETLEFLANYVVRHFGDEENLQRQYNYPGFREHKQRHDDFVKVVSALRAEHKREGSSESLGKKVSSVIVHWLIEHIKKDDLDMAEFIRQIKKTEQQN